MATREQQRAEDPEEIVIVNLRPGYGVYALKPDGSKGYHYRDDGPLTITRAQVAMHPSETFEETYKKKIIEA